jgi:hypothetical protein
MMQSSGSLDLIEIASPCPASWDEMTGDERVRYCKQCKLQVYNLSEMSRDEAKAFVQQHTAGQARSGAHKTCVRFYRREDGTVLTRDCPVGLRALRQRLVRSAAALAGVLIALVSGTLFSNAISRRMPSGLQSPAEAFADWIHPERRRIFLLGDLSIQTAPAMGGICALPALPVLQTAEPAETPLLPPTAEQLKEIQRRLAE